MNAPDLITVCILVFALLGWGLFIHQRRQTDQERSVRYNDRHEMQKKIDALTSEKDRLLTYEEFHSQWHDAPDMKAELDDLRNGFESLASSALSKDMRSEIEKIGWGVVDDHGVDYADRMAKAESAVHDLVVARRAVESLNEKKVDPAIAACLIAAFDGYVHFYMNKTRDEYEKRVRMVRLAFHLLNLRAKDSLRLAVTKDYLNAQLALMRTKEELAEHKRRKRAQDAEIRKLEEAREGYNAEEVKLRKRLATERAKLEKAHAAERARHEAEIAALERRIEELQRAKSNAELTKEGTVYVISNVNSFGENVYKIGMTRRDDPQDRVDELSSASVPFPFDVHAFIWTKNAPKLETELHHVFMDKKINTAAVHGREFYRVGMSDIRAAVEKLGYRVKWEGEKKRSLLPPAVPLTENDTSVTNVISTPVPHTSAQESLPATYESLIDHLNEKGIKWVDKRSVGGCLWVISSPETDSMIESLCIDGKRFMKARTKHFNGYPGWFIT